MKICNTFVVVPESLYTVRFEGENLDEFEKLFEQWNDSEFLLQFFEEHLEDLQGFWTDMTVIEANQRTRMEARSLERRLLAVAYAGQKSTFDNLSGLFKPLRNSTIRLAGFEKSKLKGLSRDSWLRIYAVRIDINLFVISGGAIKLTRTMNERRHLLFELEKLEIVQKHLQSGNANQFGFYEMN